MRYSSEGSEKSCEAFGRLAGTLVRVPSEQGGTTEMELKDFVIGETFWTEEGAFRCTDVATRLVIAVKLGGGVRGDPLQRRRPPAGLQGMPRRHNQCDGEVLFNLHMHNVTLFVTLCK